MVDSDIYPIDTLNSYIGILNVYKLYTANMKFK